MLSKRVTLAVLNALKSKTFNEEHPANMPSILTACEVSQLEKSKEAKLEHPPNIAPISDT